MSRVLVVAPHPDDETLGCGGTLLKHKAAGDAVQWLIVTQMEERMGHSREAIDRREAEVARVAGLYGFEAVHRLGFPAAALERVAKAELIARIGEVLGRVKPRQIYLPFPGDIHSDHGVTFDAAAACCKWFRLEGLRRLLAYETISETEQALDPREAGFRPNVFVDIAATLEQKIQIMNVYAGEMGPFPFPRSETAIRALAARRGAMAGHVAAEAFVLLRESC